MGYVAIAYTDQTTVKRLLRTANNKIRIGSSAGEMSLTDLDGFILDASKFIDGFIRAVANFDNLPVVTYSEKPEIGYAAGRLTAFFIHRAMYPSYRTEDLGSGIVGWEKDAKDQLELLKQHIEDGVYTDLSPATGGIQFVTVDQYFQTQIGVSGVDKSLRSDRNNQVPVKQGNIGPYNDGTLI